MALTLIFPSGGALVAGGTGTVGQGVTRRLAQAGVPVVFTYLRREAQALALTEELRGEGCQVWCRRMDMGDSASVAAALDDVQRNTGRLHSVIFAGGASIPFDSLADVPPETAERFFRDDAMACYRLFHAAIPHLRAGGGGSLTACTTIALQRVVVYDGLSPFSKGAVQALVRQLAFEEAQHGIRCNAVGIGWVSPVDLKTLLAQLPPVSDAPQSWEDKLAAIVEQIRGMVRLGRPATMDEAGNVFAFLASEQASFITGQSLALDGGATL